GEESDLKFVKGDISDPESLQQGMKDCDAVIHLVGIIYEIRKKGAVFEAVHYQGTLNVLKAI
ncbi:MAG: NAD-dependent epimerase/dehydratase family protein, partial [Candidatus Aminicenantes bacterium]|nr:NAD-dependent epimerase/dehydratase family protein [Candidatus Aminicenantes bacterium]